MDLRPEDREGTGPRRLVDRLRSGEIPEAHVLASVLHVSAGLVVLILSPFGRLAHPAGAAALAVIAILIGAGFRFLPWQRWPVDASKWLIPEALALVVLFDLLARDAYLYDLFFIVTWCWVGLTQPLGTAARWAPVLVLARLIPAGLGFETESIVASMVPVVLTCIVLAETIAAVTERMRRDQAALARSESRYAALVRAGHEFILVVDGDDQVVYANAAVQTVLGRDPEDFQTGFGHTLIHPDDRDRVMCWWRSRLEAHSVTDSGDDRIEVRVRRADGAWRWIELTLTDLRDQPEVAGVVVNGRDVTDRRSAQEDLEREAYTDDLTGLANRSALIDHLTQRLGRGESVHLLYLDLDGFKVINDSLGHATGDALLKRVAARLGSLAGEDGFLARLGGDEFVILAAGPLDGHDLDSRALAVVAAFRAPFDVDGRELSISASVGVATGDADCGPDELLRRADLAMYRAKDDGRARWSRFDHDLARRARERHDLETELRTAIETDQLRSHYQPIVDLRTGRIVGIEALVRWQHPERGLLAPNEFIDVAEDSGLIVGLGSWMLEKSADDLRLLSLAGYDHVWLSLNASVRQLRGAAFAAEVVASIRARGLQPSRFRIEFTESALLDQDVADAVIPILRDAGLRIAVDDFGTGYSSLSYLNRLDIDALKIDKSFLDQATPAGEAPLVEGIIRMAHALDLEVVGEGIERQEQAELLLGFGCQVGQGYLYGKPCRLDELIALLVADRDRDETPTAPHVSADPVLRAVN